MTTITITSKEVAEFQDPAELGMYVQQRIMDQSRWDREILAAKYRIESLSPYNDGWTQEMYRKSLLTLQNTEHDSI